MQALARRPSPAARRPPAKTWKWKLVLLPTLHRAPRACQRFFACPSLLKADPDPPRLSLLTDRKR